MRFTYDLTVPAATLEAAPEERTVKLVPGRLKRVFIGFRRGPHHLVFVSVRLALHRIIPVADSDSLFGDGIIYEVPMDFEITDRSPELTFSGWSPDSRYQHTVTFMLDLTPSGADERQTIFDLLLGPSMESNP